MAEMNQSQPLPKVKAKLPELTVIAGKANLRRGFCRALFARGLPAAEIEVGEVAVHEGVTVGGDLVL